MGTGGHESSGLARGVVGSARVIAFGASNVAPAGSVVAGLVVVVSYAGFASPLVVLIAFAASLCCASSIAEFARRLPSAGSLYTYGSRGLGRTGGFLVGWMMVFAYVLYVPAGIALTSAYMSNLLAGALHVVVSARALFVVIVGAVALTAYLGIKTSSSMDLVLVVGEVAIIAALAITAVSALALSAGKGWTASDVAADPGAKVEYSGTLRVLTKFGLQVLSPYFVNLAQEYEKVNEETQERYTWNQRESLEELARPERVQEIKERHEREIEKKSRRRVNLPLVEVFDEVLEDEDDDKPCFFCHT